MNVRSRLKTRKPQRRGFTLVELLVVISIIGVLASLILPAVQNAREAARRAQCMNNMRNVGIATHLYAGQNRGAFPPLAGGKDYWEADQTTPAWAPMPWTVHIMPYIDQSGLFTRLTNPTSTETSVTLRNIGIEAYTCPDDPASDNPGELSFVVNGGYITLDEWADNNTFHTVDAYQWNDGMTTAANPKRTLATGLFWRQNTPADGSNLSYNVQGVKVTLDRIPDGASQTIMLSENIDNGGWLSITTGDLAFALRLEDNDPDDVPIAAVSDVGLATFSFSGTTAADPIASKINQFAGQVASGNSPRPSSNHQALVNVIMGDGSGRSLADSIDDSVYARLISSNGNNFGQEILSSNDY